MNASPWFNTAPPVAVAALVLLLGDELAVEEVEDPLATLAIVDMAAALLVAVVSWLVAVVSCTEVACDACVGIVFEMAAIVDDGAASVSVMVGTTLGVLAEGAESEIVLMLGGALDTAGGGTAA